MSRTGPWTQEWSLASLRWRRTFSTAVVWRMRKRGGAAGEAAGAGGGLGGEGEDGAEGAAVPEEDGVGGVGVVDHGEIAGGVAGEEGEGRREEGA